MSKNISNFVAKFANHSKQIHIMKHILTFFPVMSILCIAFSMQGCTADVDLNNVDTSIQVKANVATPIGSLRATLGDFVGDGTWGIFTENGVLTFQDTFSIERKFHNIDISQYISNADIPMNVYQQLESAGIGIMSGGQMYIPGTGIQVPITFPLTLKLTGINNNTSHQRLDSVLIDHASFTSKISKIGGLPLEWDWIDKVTINMDPQFFYRPDGNIVTVYEKGETGGYDKNMKIDVYNFSLNLMKNRNPNGFQGYINNVYDECNFTITMYITIPTSAGMVHVPKDAGFQYKLGVQFIDYQAIWGMFEPGKDMSDENEIVIADAWSAWKDLKSVRLPFADPSIDVQITTQIAGALRLEGEYLYVKDENDQPVYATFDGYKSLYKTFNPNEYLSLTSPIGSSKTMSILFDKDAARGHIDRLFSVHPEKLGYKFQISFDQTYTPQIRITDNTSIKVDAVCKLPLVFNEGITLDYSDTISGLDLSTLDLDSLLADVTILDTLQEASATLALTISNDIPFRIRGVLTCLDENNNVIIDPKTSEPFLITGKDTILIPSPQYTQDQAHNWTPEPVKHIETIHVDREDLETLRKIKSIAFYAVLDDKPLSEVYEQGNFNAKLTDTEGIRIKVAIGANIEAVLNLFESNNEQ